MKIRRVWFLKIMLEKMLHRNWDHCSDGLNNWQIHFSNMVLPCEQREDKLKFGLMWLHLISRSLLLSPI